MDYMRVFDKFVQKYGRLPTEFDPDYLEMLRMSKYRIVDVPDFKPGKCANCGASKNDGRKYIDFGLEVDWYGTVYLCGECLHDVSNHMGLFEEVNNNASILKEELAGYKYLEEQGANLHDTVVNVFKEFEDYYAGLHAINDNRSPDGSTVVDSEESATKSGINAAKPRTTKPTASSGSKDVRSLADLISDAGN
jgi:hypothetical protein